MTNRDGPILVIGATGQQGGAVARELLRRGHDVLALTRNPEAPGAKQLAKEGATLVRGDLDDPASIRAAMSGAAAVFSMQTITAGFETEVCQGKVVAEAAKAASVDHVVYTSVDGAERDSGVPHFESKWLIEQHLRALGVPTTVLRPTSFMDSFAAHRPQLVDGTLLVRLAMRPDTRLQMIATADIGVFAADAFERPRAFIGEALALAGDELTGSQIAEAFQEVTGTPARFAQQPREEVRAFSDDLARMWEWFDSAGYGADIDALRQRHPQLKTLRGWLRETSWRPAVSA